MGTHNICLYKEVDKKYTCCNLKTTKLLNCALIGVCAVIRLNAVTMFSWRNKKIRDYHYFLAEKSALPAAMVNARMHVNVFD